MPTRKDAKWSSDLSTTGDIVIVGAGLAGLFTALKLAPRRCTVVAAAPLGKGASSVWAQGGMAAAVGENDTPQLHAQDTIASGAGLVDKDLALSVAQEAPARIQDLLSIGVPFDKDKDDGLRTSHEAAHSVGRVVRVSGDRAGGEIMAAIIAAVREKPEIRILENYRATDITTLNDRINGLHLIDAEQNHHYLGACAVVLATGGVGGLYSVSTNPPYALGEAIAMGARAGAVIADAEFVQFHPTALDVGILPAPLATEALRGEGAHLINSNGERFLLAHDPRAEMASRDIVAKAVAVEISAGRKVYLDCRTAIGSRFKDAFPTVYAHCIAAGIDPTSELIPVAPAAHYHMGGIATNETGRTDVQGLWAIGEAASTGLHGANRLASNSLLEAVVFAARAGDDIGSIFPPTPACEPLDLIKHDPPSMKRFNGQTGQESAALRRKLQETMSRNVGVSRKQSGLIDAIKTALEIEHHAAEHGDQELSNMALAARFIATSAYGRRESRGAHFRSDFPALSSDAAERSMLTLDDINQQCERILSTGTAPNPLSTPAQKASKTPARK